MSTHIHIDSHSCIFSFTNLMNILQNLNYLRHNNYLLNYFFNNVRNLNKFLLRYGNSNRNLLNSINNLQNLFNIIHISHNFLQLLSINQFFHVFLYLNNFSCLFFEWNNLLLISDHFLNGLDQSRNLNQFFSYFVNILVDFDDLRNHLLNFNQFRNLHQFLFNPFHLINLRQIHCFLNNLLNNFLNCDDIIDIFLYSNYLLNNSWHFFNNFLDVRYYLLHLLDLFLNQYFFNIFIDLLDFSHILNHRNNLLHNLRSRNDPFDNFLLGYHLFNYSLDRHWYFKRHYDLFINLNSLNTLIG